MKRQILERLQLLREQLGKSKKALIEQGHQQVVKDLTDQMNVI